jgi:hypothetical protein
MTEPTTPGAQVTAAQLLAFLDGSGQIDGVGFGDRHPTLPGAFWWRRFLPLLAQPPAQQAVMRQALDALTRLRDRDVWRITESDEWCDDERADEWITAEHQGLNAIAALSATQEAPR